MLAKRILFLGVNKIMQYLHCYRFDLTLLGCVWFEREVGKIEVDKKEFEKRERDEKYTRFDVLFDIREIVWYKRYRREI